MKIKFSHQRRRTNPACGGRGELSSLVCGPLRGWSHSPLQPHLLSLHWELVVKPHWITAPSLNTSVSSAVKWVIGLLVEPND